MEARVQFLSPDESDLEHIARHLRDQDLAELMAVHGPDLDVLRCLRVSVAASQYCQVAVTAWGEPVALFGLAPVSLLTSQACPWMLGTDGMHQFGRELVVLGGRYVQVWGRQYRCLFNFVDTRNTRAIRWLRRMGFEIQPAVPHGAMGLPFHRFERCT